MRVLLILENPAATNSIATVLRSNSAIVEEVDTGTEGIELTRHYDYDIVIVSLTLPDMDGTEVVRRMRDARDDTPVLVLADMKHRQGRISAFGAGADDVISIPLDTAELLARLRAIVRRSKGYSQPALRVGGLVLNIDSREVSVDGQPVHVTGKEYAILELLVLRKGMVLTKEAFLNHLYGGLDEPEMKIIDVFICKLRKKLAQAGADSLIRTVWGRGYMLVAEPLDAAASSRVASDNAPERPLVRDAIVA